MISQLEKWDQRTDKTQDRDEKWALLKGFGLSLNIATPLLLDDGMCQKHLNAPLHFFCKQISEVVI